jgi:hypothetical protein
VQVDDRWRGLEGAERERPEIGHPEAAEDEQRPQLRHPKWKLGLTPIVAIPRYSSHRSGRPE